MRRTLVNFVWGHVNDDLINTEVLELIEIEQKTNNKIATLERKN